ncbi:hypothetical protein OPV22_000334 [Ensete ventricosum]|uniref:Uncharacterized protein n=1 Tax=Ensete ventricosum TaxID=4639 RepID=A0AAV8QAF0_ENSVE|nr:hypothetical protein OPV22_000334 [Ensete ventricosum]RWW30621.1 hypothetical protein GW17_00004801 [Ensete ventricosum]RWW39223.1 hypothetical protein BHE74_00055465 [Ensete ventricosum]
MKLSFLAIFSVASSLGSVAQQCGPEAGEKSCSGGQFCSKHGYCENDASYRGSSDVQSDRYARRAVPQPTWVLQKHFGLPRDSVIHVMVKWSEP